MSAPPKSVIPQGNSSYASVSVSSDNKLLNGIVVALLLADGVRYYLKMDDGALLPLNRIPEPDPTRRINVQDCTALVTHDGGNLKCR